MTKRRQPAKPRVVGESPTEALSPEEQVRHDIRLARERRVAAERARVLGLIDPPAPEDPIVAEREYLKDEAKRIKAMGDTRVNADCAGRLVAAARLDVFAMMHQRGTVSPEQLTAIRRLETDLHLAAGVANTDDRAGTSSGGCQERVTQRMIDASGRVQLVLNDLPAGHARLLDALLSPEGHGAVLTRWRAHVERIFGKRDKEAQADVIHWTAAAVTEAYAAIDYERRCA